MRVNNVFAGRPAYYDRGPTQKALAFRSTGLAPAGNTIRTTYTVPSNRKFQGTLLWIFHSRETVAGTPGDVQCDFTLTPSGGSAAVVMSTSSLGNTVDTTRQGSANGVSMFAGDVIVSDTADTSTGGTVTYSLGFQGTEFDA